MRKNKNSSAYKTLNSSLNVQIFLNVFRDGTVRSGLFSALWCILERLRTDDDVAVADTVRLHRLRHPNVIPTLVILALQLYLFLLFLLNCETLTLCENERAKDISQYKALQLFFRAYPDCKLIALTFSPNTHDEEIWLLYVYTGVDLALVRV